jgi:hypothetical protein
MRGGLTYNSNLTVFKQWSGKAYSVFVSIGSQIRIGHIDFDICDKSLLKDKKRNSCFLDLSEFQVDKNEDSEELLDEAQNYQLIFNLLTLNSEKSSRRYCRINFFKILIKTFKLFILGSKCLLSKSECYDG